MAELTLTYQDLYNKVSEFIGWGSSPTGTDLTNAKAIVHRGYRSFLYPVSMTTGKRHIWSFLKKNTALTTQSGQWKYELPSDFQELYTRFRHDLSTGYPWLGFISAQEILQKRTYSDSSGYPTYFTIQPGIYKKELGQTWEVWFYDEPNSSYILHYSYVIKPDQLSATTDVPIGGVAATEAILECCLAKAEQEYDEVVGIHTQLANTLIQELISSDIADVPDTVGYNLDDGAADYPHTERYIPTITDPSDVYDS